MKVLYESIGNNNRKKNYRQACTYTDCKFSSGATSLLSFTDCNIKLLIFVTLSNYLLPTNLYKKFIVL